MDDHPMSSSSSSSANPQAIKRRRRTTKQELQVLEDLYAESRNPSLEARQKACNAIGFEMKALQVWLQNRRQKEKKDAGKWKPAYTATGESAVGATPHSQAQSLPTSASSRSSSVSSSHANAAVPPPLHASTTTIDHARVNTQTATARMSMPPSMSTSSELPLMLPPILDTSKATSSSSHSTSPLPTQLPPLTLPPISSVMSQDGPLSSRDFECNKLSPMLKQFPDDANSNNENSFNASLVRPSFKRTTSNDSARSSSTSSSTASLVQVREASAVSPAVLSEENLSRPIKSLRRSSSQYSLSIAQDGKAQMMMTEAMMPSAEQQQSTRRPQLPSLATVISASPSSISSSSPTLPSAISESAQSISSSASSFRKLSSTLASAPLCSSSASSSAFGRQTLFPSSNFGRVFSLPSLSTLSNTSSTACLKTHNQNTKSIFSGGLRPGSPPKKSTFANSSSTSLHTHSKKSSNSKKSTDELWMNLDSDPVEPEDEILLNHNKRMLDSPVKRFTSVKMEDVLSSASSKKRKVAHPPPPPPAELDAGMVQGGDVFGREESLPLENKGRTMSIAAFPLLQSTNNNNNSNARASPLVRSATTSNLFSSSSAHASMISSNSPSKSSISNFQAQFSLQQQQSTKQLLQPIGRGNRKRSYSKTMLSRSISLDRVMLHDDSTDEENSPQKGMQNFGQGQVRQPRSAGLYPSSGVLGRPLLSRANSHLGILHTTTQVTTTTKQQQQGDIFAAHSFKKVKLDASNIVKKSDGIAEDEEDDASGEEDVGTNERRPTEGDATADQSMTDISAEEPDLTFSNEASQSFDGTSRGDISEVETDASEHLYTQRNYKEVIETTEKEGPVLDLINEKLNNAITSTPSKKQGNTLALAALRGHITSPIKMRSPNRNGKILTEVERDCAAVLVGLGIPDVF